MRRDWGFVSGKDDLYELGCLLDLESEYGFLGEPEDVKFVVRNFTVRRVRKLQRERKRVMRREREMSEAVMSGGLAVSDGRGWMRRDTPDCGNGYELESALGVSRS